MIKKKKIQEKEKLLSNMISVYLKDNRYANLLNYNFFAIYNKDKSFTIYSKNKEL